MQEISVTKLFVLVAPYSSICLYFTSPVISEVRRNAQWRMLLKENTPWWTIHNMVLLLPPESGLFLLNCTDGRMTPICNWLMNDMSCFKKKKICSYI